MRIAIHAQALQDIFSSNCDPLTTNTILGSRISLTPSVLNQYNNSLGANPYFQTWFSSLMAANRFSIHFPQVAPTRVQASDVSSDGYGTASYFGGSTLVAETHQLPVGALTALNSIGTNLISPRNRISGTIHGDNPFFTIAIRAGGAEDFEILDRFIKPEESIVVYDKYINSTSIQLLEHLATKLSPGASIQIFHSDRTGRDLLQSSAITTRIQAANPNLSVSCKICLHNFTSIEHDRYIFLGKRIQMVFTVGLDCFGKINPTTGKRINRSSKIMFFDVTAGDNLDIIASDGSICKVNHLTDLPTN